MAVVLDVVGGHGGVGDPVVDDGVHADRHGVPGKHLLGGYIEGDRSQVHFFVGVHTRHDKEKAGAFSTP